MELQVPMLHHLTRDFAPHSHRANGLSTTLVTFSVTAPANPHATRVAVYPALLIKGRTRQQLPSSIFHQSSMFKHVVSL